ncbi:MAG: ABC transporter substrate-binding protein [Acidobacteriota bacterium]
MSPRRSSAPLGSPGAIVLVLLTILATGCRPAVEEPGPAPADGETTVVVAQPIDIQGTNELLVQATTIHTALHYFMLFLPLLEEQADYQDGPPTFAPRLAESYELSEDRLALTFRLRTDIVWSDGVPVTSADVRFTWEAQTHPEVAWPFVDTKARIRDVEVIDDHTVRFHFTEVYANQLEDVVQGVILPAHAWGKLPFEEWRSNSAWFDENLVVNGPFTLESHTPQQRFVVRRNERYFEPGLPRVDRVVFEIIPDSANQLNLLRTGKADFVEFVPPAEAESIEADPDLYLVKHIPRFFFYIAWNVTRPQFAEPEVRRALTLAIDRETIVDTLFYGWATVSHSPLVSNVWAHNKDLEPWPFDPAAARRLLAEAGWQDTDGDGVLDKDGQPFRFELMTNSENQLRKDITVMVQEQLKQVGIEVVPRSMDFNALLAPLARQEFDAVVSGLALGTDLDLTFNFHTRGITEGFNWSGYSNPEMDTLIEASLVALDPAEAKRTFDRIQVLLHEEQPLTFLYESVRPSGVRQRLQDTNPNSLSSFANLRSWRVEDTP